MKIVYNNIIPFRGYIAMMFFGTIFARKKYKPLWKAVINHETIHQAQAKDAGGYIPYYFKYLTQCVRYGYKNSPYEREAHINEWDLKYLKTRTKNAYKNYVTLGGSTGRGF